MDIISYALGKKGMQQSVSEYLDEHLTNPTNPPIDTSLTIAGAAADSKETGSRITDLKEGLQDLPNVKETDSESGVFDFVDIRGNSALRLQNGNLQTKNFDSSKIPYGCEYKFSGNDILVSYGYNDSYDAVVVLNIGRANNIFDFSALKLKTKGTSLNDYETTDLTTVWDSGTDMHSPFQFLAVNNADGYYADATSPDFTGGNHTVSINGSAVKTASSKYVRYYADGRPVSSGYGKCNHFEIKWANEVQAYNCVKADGTGRASLTEYHDMIFDGVKFDEQIFLVPSESILMSLWYGLQMVGWNGIYTNARFMDAVNRGIFIPSDSGIISGNNIASGINAWGDAHEIMLTVDTSFDLGKRGYYAGTQGAFMSNGAHKGYFSIILKNANPVQMSANESYCLKGTFRFFPHVEEV